jgi:hypothetical protein
LDGVLSEPVSRWNVAAVEQYLTRLAAVTPAAATLLAYARREPTNSIVCENPPLLLLLLFLHLLLFLLLPVLQNNSLSFVCVQDGEVLLAVDETVCVESGVSDASQRTLLLAELRKLALHA